MAKQQNSGKITIANFVSIVGIVLLLIFTFIGYSYMSGGELVWSMLISLGITGFTVFLLWFLIKAKGAENNLPKWKAAEFLTLFVYIVFSLSTSLLGGIMHFFVVNANKDDIKGYVAEDLNKIDTLFAQYKDYESAAITLTAAGLKAATAPRQVWDADLNTFMAENGIERTSTSASTFKRIQETNLLGPDYKAYFENYTQERNDIQNIVDSWNIILIPMKANLIGEIAKTTEEYLTSLSQSAQLPEITYDSSVRKYTIGNYQKKEFKIEGGINSFQFRNAIRKAEGFSITALMLVLLIQLLILFNYIVAFRTKTLDPDILEEDGGRILK